MHVVHALQWQTPHDFVRGHLLFGSSLPPHERLLQTEHRETLTLGPVHFWQLGLGQLSLSLLFSLQPSHRRRR